MDIPGSTIECILGIMGLLAGLGASILKRCLRNLPRSEHRLVENSVAAAEGTVAIIEMRNVHITHLPGVIKESCRILLNLV